MNTPSPREIKLQIKMAMQAIEQAGKTLELALSVVPDNMPDYQADALRSAEELAKEYGYSERHFAERISKIDGFPSPAGNGLWNRYKVFEWMNENGHRLREYLRRNRNGKRN